ncbi:phospholipid phosphatase 5-like [Physella acuta]|uniref:phospholipid phosphatase 5-like n=1 Tax=Physella acuta TaxID=109671 RepID=UPI0027DE347F|nr:phospholipid phosphatase 5-like [Physella acuta]
MDHNSYHPLSVSSMKNNFRSWKNSRPDFEVEIALRIAVYILFLITDKAQANRRIIQPEEAWLYKYPQTASYVEFSTLQISNVILSIIVIGSLYKYNRNISHALNAALGVSLSTYFSLVITNLIKITVGRPRPDFFSRCFKDPPTDVNVLAQALCDQNEDSVNQGYKSFPSGHSTIAFGCMAYLSLYIASSLRVFNYPKGHFPCLRLSAFIAPLLCATLVAASRTCDYHHHWQDVLVGSLIGLTVAYMSFRQSFRGLTEPRSDLIHPLSPLPDSSSPPLATVESHSSM